MSVHLLHQFAPVQHRRQRHVSFRETTTIDVDHVGARLLSATTSYLSIITCPVLHNMTDLESHCLLRNAGTSPPLSTCTRGPPGGFTFKLLPIIPTNAVSSPVYVDCFFYGGHRKPLGCWLVPMVARDHGSKVVLAVVRLLWAPAT